MSTASDNTAKWAVRKFGGAGLPVGFEYFTTNPNIPAGSLPLLGGVYSRTLYKDLWNWVQEQAGYLLEESVWQEKSAANEGNVPFYSTGDGTTTFRVPSLKCWVKGANGIEEVGGNSDTVQPKSIVGLWLVKAYGTVTNVGSTDVANIAQGLTELENRVTPIANGGTGATTAKQARINLGISGGVTALDIYPVGSLYWSKKNTDPATLFGGTWTQIKDKFILAAGDTYLQGASGGAATVTLTTNQIPSHNHTGTAASAGAHKHGMYISDSLNDNWNNFNGSTHMGKNGTKHTVASSASNVPIISDGEHSHTVTINNTGGGAAHNNMPPYVTYYCWERTA